MKNFLICLLLLIVCEAAAPVPRTWVAIGDSITYLNDHLDETGNRVTKGYLTRVAEALPEIRYVNKGYNGWTSGGIADKIETLGLSRADVYSVFLGTNDWWHSRPVGTWDDYQQAHGSATVYGAYRIIMDKLKALNPKAQIILITPMQRGDFVYINNPKNNAYGCYKPKAGQTLAQFAAAIVDIGKRTNSDVIDLYNQSGITVENCVKFKMLKDPATGKYRNLTYPEFVDIPFNPDADAYPYPIESIDMTYDGLHPSDKGNAIIAGLLTKTIRE